MRPIGAGKPTKITEDMAKQVGDSVGGGMKLEYALDLFDPPIPLDHWANTLRKHSRIAAAYRRKLAEHIRDMTEAIRVSPPGKLPVGLCWILERVQGYWSKAPTTASSTQVNIVMGMSNDIMNRARVFVHRRTEPDELKQARVRQVTDKAGDTLP